MSRAQALTQGTPLRPPTVQEIAGLKQAGRGLLVSLSGLSGSGKSTVAKGAAQVDERITVHRKDTTRPPRPAELATGNTDVRALSLNDFRHHQQRGDYFTRYWRNNAWYGIRHDQVTTALTSGAYHLLIVNDMATLRFLRLHYADQLISLLLTVDLATARQRLHQRGSETTTPRGHGLAAEQAEYLAHYSLFDSVLDNNGPLPVTIANLLTLLHTTSDTTRIFPDRRLPS